MQLTRLILNNVGQYRGETRFDLKPRHNEKNIQPIVLFGGKKRSGENHPLAIHFIVFVWAFIRRNTSISFRI